MDSDSVDIRQMVSTGALPERSEVRDRVRTAHQTYKDLDEGDVASYIPALAEADPDWFGLVVAQTNGEIHAVGDSDIEFSIQSVSKAFVYALVCEEIGHRAVKDRVGANNTGLPFDSVMALELNAGHPMNPMVNAGALATTALVSGATAEEQWETIRVGLSRFAGRHLEMDDMVYECETDTNQRNEALGRLLESYGRLESDSAGIVDLYTRQCSLRVTAKDLAIMGATLADGGVNPVTGERVVSPDTCRDTLSILASNGLYEHSGEWLLEIGLPAKSGVSGGIVAVAPGKGALGVFSPPLDEAGNSVRGRRAAAHLSRTLGLDLFASEVLLR